MKPGRTVTLLLALTLALLSLACLREYREIVGRRGSVTRARARLADLRRLHAQLATQLAQRPASAAREVEPDSHRDREAGLVSPGMADSIRDLLARQARLKQWFDDHPDRRIPEMRFVTGQQWLEETAKADSSTIVGRRLAAAHIRYDGMVAFASKLGQALKRYVSDHAGELPIDIYALGPYLADRSDAPLLDRYEMIARGPAHTKFAETAALGLKPGSLVDSGCDVVSSVGIENGSIVLSPQPSFFAMKVRAAAAYANAHGGVLVQDDAQLVPYFSDPRDAETARENARQYQEQIATKKFPPPGSWPTISGSVINIPDPKG